MNISKIETSKGTFKICPFGCIDGSDTTYFVFRQDSNGKWIQFGSYFKDYQSCVDNINYFVNFSL